MTGAVPYYVAALLAPNDPHWGANGNVVAASTLGQAATVSYAFLTSSSLLARSDQRGFAAMSETQKAATRQALNAWAQVANVTFVETADTARANISFATNTQSGVSAAYTYYPGDARNGGAAVLIANDVKANATPTTGSYAYTTFVHEIGHALGLKHPGNYNAGSSSGESPPFLPASEDTTAYSVMSYNADPALPSGIFPVGPGIDDIAAVQYLYGPNLQAAPGDDVYTLSLQGFRTVWDPNGLNTIDGRGQTAGERVDLRGGQFTRIGATDVLALAYGTQVRQALGGAGDDVFQVNGLGDRIDGGGGANTVVFSGASGQYALSRTEGGAFIVTGADGVDALVNVQAVRFADGATVALGAGTIPAFDALRYLCSNGDLATAFGTDTLAAGNHYATTGVFENRAIASFDPYRYLAGYGDLITGLGDDQAVAERHYLISGRGEGRDPTRFDTLRYIASNGDLITAFATDVQAAEIHYIDHGYAEHRALSAFDAVHYLAVNGDLRLAYGTDTLAATRHYILYGYAEHRTV